MAIVTSLVGAGLLGSEKEGVLLGDQEYYNKFIRPEEERLMAGAGARAGVARRGMDIRRRQFAASNDGVGLTGGGVDPRARRGLNRALQSARMEGEELRRQKFAERDRKRAEIGQAMGTISGAESAIGSAILGSNPVTAGFAPLHAGITAGAGMQMQGALQAIPVEQAKRAGTYGTDLLTVDYGPGGGLYDDDDLLRRTRGGGGADFYRTFGG